MPVTNWKQTGFNYMFFVRQSKARVTKDVFPWLPLNTFNHRGQFNGLLRQYFTSRRSQDEIASKLGTKVS